MSYNDSYFGEPAGLVKHVAYQLDRLVSDKPQAPAVQADIEKDAERLDWLQKQMQRGSVRMGYNFKEVNAWSIAADGDNLREAIDSAIKAQKGGEQ